MTAQHMQQIVPPTTDRPTISKRRLLGFSVAGAVIAVLGVAISGQQLWLVSIPIGTCLGFVSQRKAISLSDLPVLWSNKR